MKIKNIQTSGWKAAFHGMRHPMESYDKSDSFFGLVDLENCTIDYEMADAWAEHELERPLYTGDNHENDQDIINKYDYWLCNNSTIQFESQYDLAELALIGPQDMELAQKLIRAGEEHSKFLRMIHISMDITAPLYWWKEMDTYKVATTANSTSTMHKLATTPITLDCFEIDDYKPNLDIDGGYDHDGIPYETRVEGYIGVIIDRLEYLRVQYLNTKNIYYWKELIRWLPESWLQTRTWDSTYPIVRKILRQRDHHKLTEWHTWREAMREAPYAEELLFYN